MVMIFRFQLEWGTYRMLGWTIKMLGQTLGRTYIDPICVVFIGHNSNLAVILGWENRCCTACPSHVSAWRLCPSLCTLQITSKPLGGHSSPNRTGRLISSWKVNAILIYIGHSRTLEIWEWPPGSKPFQLYKCILHFHKPTMITLLSNPFHLFHLGQNVRELTINHLYMQQCDVTWPSGYPDFKGKTPRKRDKQNKAYLVNKIQSIFLLSLIYWFSRHVNSAM